MFAATVLTLFPAMFPGPLGQSLAGEALARSLWSLEACDIREHGLGRHRAVDDTPAGGGPGMVMRADVIAASLDAAVAADDPRPRLIMSARGRAFHPGAGAPMGGGAGARHRLPALRGRRRARDRGARPHRGLDRRLCAFGRRDRGAGRARRLRAAHSRRDGQRGVGRGGKLREGPARISPLHPPARHGRAAPSPRFCSRAITPGSPPGAMRNRSGSRVSGGPT